MPQLAQRCPLTLPGDTAAPASLDHLEAQAADTHPRAQPRHLGSSSWPEPRTSGRPKVDDLSPLWTPRLSNWVFNFLVAQTFLDLVELLHSWGAFLVYAGFSLGGGVWMYYYLPETMNLSLEEVATLFRDPYPAPLRAQQARAKVAAPKKEIDKLLPK